MLLEGRTAFVTGGGSGIGRATALTFAREGARVAITDLDAASAEETARTIRDGGGDAYGEMLNVTDVAAVDAFIDMLVDRWGRLDIAFNNAGVSLEGIDTPWGDADAWERSIAVNASGVVNCIRAEFRHMIPAGRGAIVNTASIAGLVGLGGPGYCGSKHAVVGITRSAAMSVAQKGIRVNAVCPGTIETPMTAALTADDRTRQIIAGLQPVGRIGQASEVAEAVLFLVSDMASFITGHPLPVDGGKMAR